jgi:hypothetical protein
MPANTSCFRYSANVAADPGAGTNSACFQYPHSCFSYQPHMPRSMPIMCFSYPFATPARSGSRDAAPPGLRQMPTTSTCFRY